MIEFIKTDRFLLLIVVLGLLVLYGLRPVPETLELLKICIAGFIGLLRGSGGNQQTVLLPESGKLTQTNIENLRSLLNKE